MNLTFSMLQDVSSEVTVTLTTIKFKHERLIQNNKSVDNEKVNDNTHAGKNINGYGREEVSYWF